MSEIDTATLAIVRALVEIATAIESLPKSAAAQIDHLCRCPAVDEELRLPRIGNSRTAVAKFIRNIRANAPHLAAEIDQLTISLNAPPANYQF